MGEYARYGGTSIKIGTCEDMYYLRASQCSLVRPEKCSLDPSSEAARRLIRFRFPWPDEDHVLPGAFDKHDRSLGLWHVPIPEDVEHHSAQFTHPGYVVSLPCPEAPGDRPYTIHRNGHPGLVQLQQQAFRGGKLVIILACGGCGAAWNVPTLEEARPVIEEIRAMKGGHGPGWYEKVAQRIEEGYR